MIFAVARCAYSISSAVGSAPRVATYEYPCEVLKYIRSDIVRAPRVEQRSEEAHSSCTDGLGPRPQQLALPIRQILRFDWPPAFFRSIFFKRLDCHDPPR